MDIFSLVDSESENKTEGLEMRDIVRLSSSCCIHACDILGHFLIHGLGVRDDHGVE